MVPDHRATILGPFFDHAIWEGPKPLLTISAKFHKCVSVGHYENVTPNLPGLWGSLGRMGDDNDDLGFQGVGLGFDGRHPSSSSAWRL